jgi:RES domain-containing protein
MKLTAWRITRKKYLDQAFSGEGAKIWGGRWNPAGYPAVHCAENLSLAILELIVHLEDDIDVDSFIAVPVSFDSKTVRTLDYSQLPEAWDHLPISPASMEVGRIWLDEKKFLALQVQSIIVPVESNYIFNPLHPDYSQIEIGEPQGIRFDPRIASLIAYIQHPSEGKID